jgi:hypothetical protein
MTILQSTSTPATGTSVRVAQTNRTFQATVTGTGAVSATVIVEGSNDNVGWLEIGTITLSGTGSASDGFASNAPWAFVRARCSSISGTGAQAVATMGA